MIRVSFVNVSPEGGVPKFPIPRARICETKVEGDKQNNLKHHGGIERAVCLYSLELIKALNLEGHPLEPGSTGENITLEGMDWSLMKSGLILKIGNSEIKLTYPTTPCKKISESFLLGDFSRISEIKNPGWSRWYASVIKEGMVNKGDIVSIV